MLLGGAYPGGSGMTLSMLAPPPKALELRPYQVEAVQGLRDGLRAGHQRQILCAPTGSGKTEMAFHLIEEARAKGSRVAFVCDRRVLVQQTHERMSNYGIPHGVIMADETYGRREQILVCSAQTIEKREFWPDLDILIIDEAHTKREKIMTFAREWGGPTIGLTATPLAEGLGDTYSNVVNVTTTNKLLADDYLAPIRAYQCVEIDMQGAKKIGGEWTDSEVHARAKSITGDVVSEWVRNTQLHFGKPVKTLLFSSTVAHGADLCAAFQAAGYDFRQSTYRDSGDDTVRMVNRFKASEFQGLVSVDKFVKGFDVPDVLCLVGVRPYSSSLMSFLQQLGRGMRTSPGKEYALYLDHAGNFQGWLEEVLEFWDKGVAELTPEKEKKQRKEGHERQDSVCVCGYIMPPGETICPSCGREMKRRSNHATRPGRMEEVVMSGSREWRENPRWVWHHICAMANHWQRNATSSRKFALAQYRTMYGDWPSYDWGGPADIEPVVPDRRVVDAVKRQLKAYRKGNG